MDWRKALGAVLGGRDLESAIDPDETVVFFPTYGCWDEQGRSWTIPVHGWIYEAEETSRLRRVTLKFLRRAMRLELGPEEKSLPVYEQRMGSFLVDNERGQIV